MESNGIALEELNVREKQIVRGLMKGLTLPQIAEELGLTYFTVKAYKSILHDKLRARSSAQIVAIALKHNLLT